MRIPSSINKNALTTYQPHRKLIQNAKNILQSANFDTWDEDIPKSLQDLCVETIAKNWDENPIIEDVIPTSSRYHLIDILRTDLPLYLTIPKIHDDVYWRNCYIHRWPNCIPKNVKDIEIKEIVRNNDLRKCSFTSSLGRNSENGSRHGSLNYQNSTRSSQISQNRSNKIFEDVTRRTWKEYFIEMYIKEYLEQLKPEDYDAEKMKEIYDLCSPYVNILRMDQMQCSVNACNRFPLNSILIGFQNLKELSLCCKQTYIGEDFTWNVLKLSIQDVKLLAKGLEKLRLKLLRITNSDIDCDKLILIIKSLLKHEMEVLDFSHCKIADRGIYALSKFMTSIAIKDLILTNNKFGLNGVKALSYALSQDSCHLSKLDIRLNNVSEGIKTLTNVIAVGVQSLKSLLIAGCGFSDTIPLENMLMTNNSLELLDISNNYIFEEGGQKILKGLKYNASIKKLDLRMCKIPSDIEMLIHLLVDANRKTKRVIDIAVLDNVSPFTMDKDIISQIENILEFD